MARSLIVELHSDNSAELLSYLESITLPMYGVEGVSAWRAEVKERSLLGEYLVKGETIPINAPGIELSIPEPQLDLKRPCISAPWDLLLHSISIPLTAACAAGGCKVLC